MNTTAPTAERSMLMLLPHRIRVVACPACQQPSGQPCRSQSTGVIVQPGYAHLHRQYAYAELAALINSANPEL